MKGSAMRGDRDTHPCMGYLYLHVQMHVYARTAEREPERKREREEARTSVAFPPAAYPPPLLDRGRRGERGGTEERRNEGREETARERSATQAAKELSAILFYLSRLPLDRIHRFLTFAFSVTRRARPFQVPSSAHRRQTGDRGAVQKNAKWPEIFVCASLSHGGCAVATARRCASTAIYPKGLLRTLGFGCFEQTDKRAWN